MTLFTLIAPLELYFKPSQILNFWGEGRVIIQHINWRGSIHPITSILGNTGPTQQ